ncbi:MAG TPA: hypothetical protein VMD91_01285 [Candidatus Sulfotelmatobacter sp.]|nr:hypothetical protein [Candidatus Sulfotelmatobacter sp.]
MIRAYRLTTGADGNSHVERGAIADYTMVDAVSVLFRETPAHASLDWHNAPHRQYVVTLSGTLEFTTKTGETCVIRPGDVLVALDVDGTGHEWRLIDDQPWKRVYVVFPPGADPRFVPD